MHTPPARDPVKNALSRAPHKNATVYVVQEPYEGKRGKWDLSNLQHWGKVVTIMAATDAPDYYTAKYYDVVHRALYRFKPEIDYIAAPGGTQPGPMFVPGALASMGHTFFMFLRKEKPKGKQWGEGVAMEFFPVTVPLAHFVALNMIENGVDY